MIEHKKIRHDVFGTTVAYIRTQSAIFFHYPSGEYVSYNEVETIGYIRMDKDEKEMEFITNKAGAVEKFQNVAANIGDTKYHWGL